MKFPEYFTENCFTEETEEIIFHKVQALLRAMTVEEKAELCHGGMNPPLPGQIGNGGYLKGVPRLGVPEIRMYDGPAGVTSKYETTGLPAEELLASTFSRELAYDFGKVSGSENHMVSGNCQLGAEVDLVRTTHFNRTRDMLGEDPYLASELAIPLVKGIQDEHVIATLKHFAGYVVPANPADSPDTVIDEQTMHELYLRTFEKAIRKGRAAGVMTSYGRINGTYASNAKELLVDVLREEWNFAGLTMSDWGANHSFSLHKGLDMEMPVGAYNSTERIMKFLAKGKLSMAELDAAAGHVLYALGRIGYLSLVSLDSDGNAEAEEGRGEPIRIPDVYGKGEKLREENAGIAERIVEKGAVLLKNQGAALPIQKEDYRGASQVTLIGLGAEYPICGYGQERSYGTLKYMTSPCEELLAEAGADGNIRCEIGLDLVGSCIPEEVLYLEAEGEAHGFSRYYGITREDGFRPPLMSMGGAGEEFKGVASRDEEEDVKTDDDDGSLDFMPMDLFMPSSDAADMEGHETGSLCSIDPVISFTCGTGVQNYKNQADGNAFAKGAAYTWRGYLEAPEEGEYQLNLHAIGGVAIFKIDIDGTGFTDVGMIKMREGTQWPWGNLVSTKEGMEICATRVWLEKGKRYPIQVYGKALLDEKDFQIRLAWLTPSERDARYRAAVDAAAQSKKVLFFAHEGFKTSCGKADGALSFQEGTDLRLEEEQKKLLLDTANAVHKNGGRMIVLAYHGSAFAMKEWIDQADALMYLWMPGQCGAKALVGKANPGGKLPQTFPNDNEDTLVSDTDEHKRIRWDGIREEGKPAKVTATEGIFTGYRWYEKEMRTPLFPFGFGLSYTSFAYSDFQVKEEGGRKAVAFAVTNTGTVAGDEIVQVYIGAGEVPEYAMTARKQLCGFERLMDIQPGEKRRVTIPIEEESLVFWDVKAGYTCREDGTKDKWRKVSGMRSIMVGASSSDIRFQTVCLF